MDGNGIGNGGVGLLCFGVDMGVSFDFFQWQFGVGYFMVMQVIWQIVGQKDVLVYWDVWFDYLGQLKDDCGVVGGNCMIEGGLCGQLVCFVQIGQEQCLVL